MEVRGGAAPTGSHSGAVLDKPSNEVSYSRMRVFFCSCWFFISGSLIWLFSFIAGHLFRIGRGKSSQIRDLKSSLVNDSKRDSCARDCNLFEEKDTPCLNFKFQHQISALQNSSDKELLQYDDAKEDISYTSTGTNNYRFASVKDLSGFMEEPQVQTFFVQESLGDPDIFSAYDDKNINTLQNTGFPTSEGDPLPSSKAADFFAVHTIDKLDGTREEKFPSAEPLEKEKPVVSETKLSGKFEAPSQAKFLFQEFSGFDSDTESLSASDGYSVKELIVDSDSDGLLSDHEHEAEGTAKGFIDATRYKLKLLADIRRLETAQLKLVHDFDEESAFEIDKFSFVNSNLDEKLLKREQKGLSQGEAESNQNKKFAESKLLPLDPSIDSSDGGYHDTQKQIILRKNSDEILFSNDVVKPDGMQDEDLVENEVRIDDNIDSTESTDSVVGGLTNFSQQIPGTDQEDAALMAELNALEHVKELEGEDNTPKDGKEKKETNIDDWDDDEDSDDGGLTNFSQQIPGTDQEDAALMAELDALERVKELEGEDNTPKDGKEKKETNIDDWDDDEASDDEDDSDDELASLWEHEDLVEQLKNEIKRMKAISLPTIKEESETLKTDSDLKPWKMDEKFLHEDPMDELHKFYNCYRGRMRKFDILNYQKMHAIGLLQVKDSLPSLGHQKSFIPAITSIISQSFGSCSGKFGINPSEKFIKELQNDLEMAYVGQTCLSWEFLRWQYEKARQMPESDPYRSHQYNQVAGRFQQFQVTVQRFIEDETFQGPRLPNYVKNRCGLQNLLLVPVIREDSLKEKREDQQKGNYVITSEILEDIMEESIRIFWEFVKADKDETSGILKGLMGPRAELQDPSDYEFMADIHSNLQKKEKKLKDLVRTGNCLVKKFKKPKEDRSNQDLFFSQVDLKLISRVLRMSRVTTDQLVWCHAKLSCITFMERKVHREPSFLLFPC